MGAYCAPGTQHETRFFEDYLRWALQADEEDLDDATSFLRPIDPDPLPFWVSPACLAVAAANFTPHVLFSTGRDIPRFADAHPTMSLIVFVPLLNWCIHKADRYGIIDPDRFVRGVRKQWPWWFSILGLAAILYLFGMGVWSLAARSAVGAYLCLTWFMGSLSTVAGLVIWSWNRFAAQHPENQQSGATVS